MHYTVLFVYVSISGLIYYFTGRNVLSEDEGLGSIIYLGSLAFALSMALELLRNLGRTVMGLGAVIKNRGKGLEEKADPHYSISK
ncbi:MAG: hypothetical protein ABFR63_02050 [Thermodesulfobacteriota bacterium]